MPSREPDWYGRLYGLLAEGVTHYRELGLRLGVSASRVSEVLTRLRREGDRRAPPAHAAEPPWCEEMFALHRVGLRPSGIAASLGVQREKVRKQIEKARRREDHRLGATAHNGAANYDRVAKADAAQRAWFERSSEGAARALSGAFGPDCYAPHNLGVPSDPVIPAPPFSGVLSSEFVGNLGRITGGCA